MQGCEGSELHMRETCGGRLRVQGCEGSELHMRETCGGRLRVQGDVREAGCICGRFAGKAGRVWEESCAEKQAAARRRTA